MNIYQNSEDEFMKHGCNICGKQMLTKNKLKQHEDAAHKNKGFECTECDHWVKSRNSLSQHKRAVHEGLKYPCRQCDHTATTKPGLAQHKRAVHEGEAVSGKFNHRWKWPVSKMDETYIFGCEIENIRKQCTLVFAKNGFLWILEGPGLFFGQ